MFALLPWPFIQRFIRRGHQEPNRVQQQCDLEASVNRGVEKADIIPVTPRKDGHGKFPKAEHLGTEEAMNSED